MASMSSLHKDHMARYRAQKKAGHPGYDSWEQAKAREPALGGSAEYYYRTQHGKRQHVNMKKRKSSHVGINTK